jgi:hypothetical protein
LEKFSNNIDGENESPGMGLFIILKFNTIGLYSILILEIISLSSFSIIPTIELPISGLYAVKIKSSKNTDSPGLS